MTLTRRQTLIEAAATVATAALPAVAMAETVAVDEEYLSFLALCLRDGAAPYGARWTRMLVYKGRRCMIIASAPETDGSWLKPTRGSSKTRMLRCLYGAMTLMVFMAIPAPGQKETPISPRGEYFLGAYSSLCLRLFCPGDFRGCWGDGGKSPEGPACDEHLAPTGQEPSVTAITIWSISHHCWSH